MDSAEAVQIRERQISRNRNFFMGYTSLFLGLISV